jgi:hypothetical protein
MTHEFRTFMPDTTQLWENTAKGGGMLGAPSRGHHTFPTAPATGCCADPAWGADCRLQSGELPGPRASRQRPVADGDKHEFGKASGHAAGLDRPILMGSNSSNCCPVIRSGIQGLTIWSTPHEVG